MRQGASSSRAILLVFWVCSVSSASVGQTLVIEADEAGARSVGPDLIVGALHRSLAGYGSEGGISAFAVGTTLCNLGDEEVQWVGWTNQHPVVAHNIYRLKDGRFEQIGVSWVKHENTALQGNACRAGCQPSDNLGRRLGVGCSSASTAGIHGLQTYLSLRSEVNAHTGYFTYPPTQPPLTESLLERRLQVHDVDLDPTLNVGALYFVEGQHIAADDAQAGNGNNNASYARISFWWDSNADMYRAIVNGETQRQQPAIRAWQDNDPTVVETDVQIPGEGLFILAAKAIDLENGGWEYSYALQNLNSDRSCGVFRVPVPGTARVAAIRFHDVDYHSGEPYDGTDWTATRSGNVITWATTEFDINPNANALRWGTLYSFRFRSDAPPAETSVTLGLFKPGDPSQVTARTIGPTMGSIDCNGNEIPDACDIDCAALDCTAPCGESADCQPNGVPDECEADCDGDGLPDDCDGTFADCDEDGIADCLDLCKCTSDPGACVCPLTGLCCFPDEICIPDHPHASCCALGAIPECPCDWSPCIAGCMLEEVNGDSDRDGDSDMKDTSDLVACFSGPAGEPGFVEPPARCRARFDFDADRDIDHADYKTFQSIYTGP